MGIFGTRIKPQPFTPFDRVAVGVYGLNRMGVIMARALTRSDKAVTVMGVDADPERVRYAMQDYTIFFGGELTRLFRGCRAVFIADGGSAAEVFSEVGTDTVIVIMTEAEIEQAKIPPPPALPKGARCVQVAAELFNGELSLPGDKPGKKPNRKQRAQLREAAKIGFPMDAEPERAERGSFTVTAYPGTLDADLETVTEILAKITG